MILYGAQISCAAANYYVCRRAGIILQALRKNVRSLLSLSSCFCPRETYSTEGGAQALSQASLYSSHALITPTTIMRGSRGMQLLVYMALDADLSVVFPLPDVPLEGFQVG